MPSFHAFGSAGPGANDVILRITPRTVFALGSVKTFTAAFAAYLSAEGMIGRLDEAHVASDLGNAACTPPTVSGTCWQSLTFRALATHTSVMPDEADGDNAKQPFNEEPP